MHRSEKLIQHARKFAFDAHKGQKRKYTNEPYIVHPYAVAELVSSVTDDCEMICAALLHDVIEDCGVTRQELFDAGFGFGIAHLVEELTNITTLEDGNRAKRKYIERHRLSKISTRGKTIKLADIIDNSKTILKHDPKFGAVYLKEIKLLLPMLQDGNKTLYDRAKWIAYRREENL